MQGLRGATYSLQRLRNDYVRHMYVYVRVGRVGEERATESSREVRKKALGSW